MLYDTGLETQTRDSKNLFFFYVYAYDISMLKQVGLISLLCSFFTFYLIAIHLRIYQWLLQAVVQMQKAFQNNLRWQKVMSRQGGY